MQSLADYKKDNRFTIQDLTDKFGVPYRTMYSWIRDNRVWIKGRANHKVIFRKMADEVLAEEGQ